MSDEKQVSISQVTMDVKSVITLLVSIVGCAIGIVGYLHTSVEGLKSHAETKVEYIKAEVSERIDTITKSFSPANETNLRFNNAEKRIDNVERRVDKLEDRKS